MKLPKIVAEFIKSWEGGDTITNDKDDTGKLTRWGISQVNNPDVDVRNLTESMAMEIYYDRYWLPSKCPALQEYMRLVQMNCAVNCGVRTAVKTLQRTIGTTPDGKVGKITLAKVKNYNQKPRTFVGWYLTYQAMYYFNIVERRRSQHKWLKGWIRRTIDAAWQTAVNYGRGK